MVRRTIVVVAGAAIGLAIACGPGFLDGLVSGVRAPQEAGLPDARTCTPARAPAPSGAPDSLPNTDVLFAFESVRIDTRPGDAGLPAAQGLDQDDRCTCPEPRSCTPPDAATTQCDGENGRDNALGIMFNTLGDLVRELRDDFATQRIGLGEYNILLDVTEWNGTGEDPNVVVAILSSEGFDSSDAGSSRVLPAFDGTDVWTLSPRSLFDGDLAIGRDCRLPESVCAVTPTRIARGDDGRALVTGGVLVARFSAAPLLVNTSYGPLVLDLIEPTIVARIEPRSLPDGGVRHLLRGEMSGVWPADRVLRAVADLESFRADAGQPSRLCVDPTLSAILKSIVCASADLPATGAPPQARCNALSAAFTFTAGETVRPSRVYRGLDRDAAPCPPLTDDCTN